MEEYDEKIRKLKEELAIIEEQKLLKIEEERIKKEEELEKIKIEEENKRKIEEEKLKVDQEKNRIREEIKKSLFYKDSYLPFIHEELLTKIYKIDFTINKNDILKKLQKYKIIHIEFLDYNTKKYTIFISINGDGYYKEMNSLEFKWFDEGIELFVQDTIESFTFIKSAKLKAWFDASDTNGNGSILLNGTEISKWIDKSDNQNNAIINNLSKPPVLITNCLNSLPVLDLRGSTALGFNLGVSTNVYSIFTVQYAKGNKDWQRLLNGQSGGDGYLLYGLRVESDAWITTIGNSNWESLESNKPEQRICDEWSICDLIISENKSYNSINGNSQINREWNSIGKINSIEIGSWVTSNVNQNNKLFQSWQGFVAEIMIFDGTINESERKVIQGYLAWKWGLNTKLPNDHLYKNNAPSITNNIINNLKKMLNPIFLNFKNQLNPKLGNILEIYDNYVKEEEKLRRKEEEKRIKIEQERKREEEQRIKIEQERKEKEQERMTKEVLQKYIKTNQSIEVNKLIIDNMYLIKKNNYKELHEDLINSLIKIASKIPFKTSILCENCNRMYNNCNRIYAINAIKNCNGCRSNMCQKCISNGCQKCIGYKFNKNQILEILLKKEIIDIKYDVINNKSVRRVGGPYSGDQMYEYNWHKGIIKYINIYGKCYTNEFEVVSENNKELDNLYFDNNLYSIPFEKNMTFIEVNYYQIAINEKYIGIENVQKILKIKEKERLEEEAIRRFNLEQERIKRDKQLEENEISIITKYSKKIGLSYENTLTIFSKICTENYEFIKFRFHDMTIDLIKYFQIINKYSKENSITNDQTEIIFKSTLKNVLIQEKIIETDSDILRKKKLEDAIKIQEDREKERYRIQEDREEERRREKHAKISNLLAQAQMTNNYGIFNSHGINYGDIREYFGTSAEPGVDQIINRIKNSMW
jgi:hypothetical protein